ncbi:MAG: aminotransferase class I/II-fold pyridoxal phosphate-dependent enzyme [Litorilinea sp.]
MDESAHDPENGPETDSVKDAARARRLRVETLAVHAGRHSDPATGAVMPPIHLSTTFARNADGTTPAGYVYARSENPNRHALEEALAQLEGGTVAAAFASGQAATMTVLQTLGAGDHVILPDSLYYGTRKLAEDVFGPWQLSCSFVDMQAVDNVRAVLRPNTRLIWVETPSNPLLTVTDIGAVAELARAHGARCVVDNTWATPINQQPLALGAHLVMHATTKFLGGHSDILGGVLIAGQSDTGQSDAVQDDDWFARIRMIQTTGGAVAAPFDCWLLLRSLRTLPYRVRAHNANALAVAQGLAAHPAVEAVYYPGLSDFAGHAVAARQMTGFGGVLSILVRGGGAAAQAVAGRTQLFTQATSLGGVESLIEHRASVEGPTTTTPVNLLRLSIGLEHPADLLDDLQQALDAG